MLNRLTAAKRFAVETGRTLTSVIEDALRQSLLRRPASEQPAPEELPIARGGGVLQPGVDLDDSAALLELMESSDASR